MLGMTADSAGNKSLAGATFVKQRFPELVFGPALPGVQDFIVENTRFENCVIQAGMFYVFDGVILRNVVFDNVSSADAFTISTRAVLDHVIVSGSPKRGGLWVKPFETRDHAQQHALGDWLLRIHSRIDVMLDISSYRGPEVEIVGLPPEKIVIDPERHFVVRREWKDSIDWKELSIPPTGFIRTRLVRLQLFKAAAGIYDRPSKGEENYGEAMKEFAQLREIGVL